MPSPLPVGCSLHCVLALTPKCLPCPCWGQGCHQPALPIPRFPGSSVERQSEVPGHLAWRPRLSCHLPPDQKEVTEHPRPQRRSGHPHHYPPPHHSLPPSLPRAGRLLFPPLPKPVGTKAVQFSDSEMSQVRCKVQEGADPTAPNAHGTALARDVPPQTHPTLRASPGDASWNPRRGSTQPSCCWSRIPARSRQTRTPRVRCRSPKCRSPAPRWKSRRQRW